MANIAKVESNTKNNLLIFCIAEAHPILWKYSESREQYKKQLVDFLHCRGASYIMEI